MQIEHVKINFERKSKIQGFQYKLFPPASMDEIKEIEQRLNVKIPEKVCLFYSHYNGLEVDHPQLFIKPIQHWEIYSESLIHFATFDDSHRLCFETSEINEADQWSIINCETGYFVTYTMPSFWTNKLWNWIVKRRTIWKQERYSG